MIRAYQQRSEKMTASVLPKGSLARGLMLRLMPAILLLVVLDLVATYLITHKLEIQGWTLDEIFWVMVVGQCLLMILFSWVVVRGVRAGMRGVHVLSDEISARSANDLHLIQLPDALPTELQPLLRHTNDLLTRLDDALAAQRRFVGNAAHQLRTPLAGLKMESELMLAQDLPSDIRVRAQRIKDVSDRMIRLGQQLLVLAKLDPEARAHDQFVRMDLCEWIRHAGEPWIAEARKAGLDIQLDAPEEPVWIDGDPLLLDEMLGNLIDNAIRYASGATHIRLQIGSNPPSLSVEDDGCGISLQEQGRVFEAFYRSPSARTGGAGLGLAIVREMTRAHGGWWSLVSRPQYSGTRMTVVFPGPRKGTQFNRLVVFHSDR